MLYDTLGIFQSRLIVNEN
ncbi:hypothetical protein LINGRAHAP2_LOCUS3234 [Linum grandiflorum]